MSEVEQLRQRVAELEALTAEQKETLETMGRQQTMLRKSESLYRTAISNLPGTDCYLYDHDLRFLLAEGTEMLQHGLSKAALEGKTLRQVVDEETAALLEPHYRKALQGSPSRIELAYEDQHYLVKTVPITDEQEDITGGMAFIHNITERVRMEEELRERERLYRTLFEEALNPIMMADETGQYTDANRAALEFLECTQEELLEKCVWDFAPEGLLERQKREHTPFVSRRTLETEYLIHGNVKTLLLNVVPVKTRDETIVYGIGQDITERVQAEEELRQHRKHLEARVKERTAELRNLVDTMAGREVRMAGLKEVIKILRAQLEREDLEPVADDPLLK